jgi:hypothetical protein
MISAVGLAQQPRLRYELQVEPVSSSASVPVVFRLFNDGLDAVRVLTWQTPLEGIRGRVFTVRCAGAEVAYRGAMIKRGAPGSEHFVTIPPGRSVEGKVDLARAYDLPSTGACDVSFRGRLLEVRSDGTDATLARDVEIAGNTASFTIR